MSDTTSKTDLTNDDTPITVVEVPEEYAEKVLEYVTTLREEADVSGYSFSTPVRVSGGGPISGSNCSTTGGTFKPTDFRCGDSDITT